MAASAIGTMDATVKRAADDRTTANRATNKTNAAAEAEATNAAASDGGSQADDSSVSTAVLPLFLLVATATGNFDTDVTAAVT